METFIYKDCVVSRHLKGLINHMEVVEGCRGEIQALGQQWDLLTILGQISGENMDMSSTREGFKNLTSELLDHLAGEILNKTVRQIKAKAQVAVDIVIRNLFERTADIGFLATDDDVRYFLRNGGSEEELRTRFREYVAKYSVYDNIILLDTEGNIRVQLDSQNANTQSTDPLIRESMETSKGFVEIYRHSDLMPHRDKTLIYAYRVTENNRPESPVLGVLCLCFRFENEMEGIFNELTVGQSREVILLVDSSGRAIASSDHYHIPPGAKLPLIIDAPYGVTWFSGRPYLSKTCRTHGYQGYMGLGWCGHVMIPLEQAFAEDDSGDNELDPSIFYAVMENERLFPSTLRRIPREAAAIQQDLDCTVWNGNIRHDHPGNNTNGILLWEIGRTGKKTQTVFNAAIGRLHQTVVAATLNEASFIASLAITIMDRNLYERANDCRWWALTGRFSELLIRGTALTKPEQEELCSILKYINGLYTVYSTLLLFDGRGVVVAGSTETSKSLIGEFFDAELVKAILALRDSQKYKVSCFSTSPLYDNRPTFIYGAAILGDQSQAAGGIAIVFDSESQFQAMLVESMPRNTAGQMIDGAIGLFVDTTGLVIAACGGGFRPGEKIDFPSDILTPSPGISYSGIYQHKETHYAVGARVSTGYREYKGESDDYQYRITAIIMVPLGKATTVFAKLPAESGQEDKGSHRQKEREKKSNQENLFATFYSTNHWFALPVDEVREAVTVNQITRLPELATGIAGAVLYQDHSIPVLDLKQITTGHPSSGNQHLIVVTSAGDIGLAGIIVDRLGPILPGNASGPAFDSLLFSRKNAFIKGVIKAAEVTAGSMTLVLSPEDLLKTAGGENLHQIWNDCLARVEAGT